MTTLPFLIPAEGRFKIERGPFLKTVITLAICKLSGNIPCLSIKFKMFVNGRNVSSAAEDHSKG